ncbi:MAG: tRNA pseudouridine(13) synthase TruD [Pseudomonadales bacterium]|nr:tRNA pseudouridine(13) synthase TruD [Pseudomonadales bacterium]MDP6471718.1 tRNA pseudouridine(13) synthase TruD [Pseudomonadales bacterium]MDP6971450.1 tRNA pseudouridine(13) synthase TruD [Pseudomonadales bacterium]
MIRRKNGDFTVEELPLPRAEEDGEHLYLEVRKEGVSTADAARWIASYYGCPMRDVGYAGMKDRHAVTRQWFSVPSTTEDVPPASAAFEVLAKHRGRKKLRRGELAGNHFEIRLREASVVPELPDRVPNFFGYQRFGHDNIASARSWLAERRRHRVSAFRRGLHLSVLRSLLFNEVLAARVRAANWSEAVDGDVLEGVYPTGPLWGRGRSPTGGEAAVIEQAALAPWCEVCEGLEHAGVRQDRRSLMVQASAMTARPCGDGDGVVLAFSLPAGSYATTYLGAVFQVTDEALEN